MKKQLLILLMVWSFGAVMAQSDGLPANPEPGKCYVKCTTPDEFRTETVTVEVRPAYKVLKVVPPKYKWVTEKVLVKEASKKYIYHPATYKTVKVPYIKKEASKTYRVIPAKFGNSTQEIEVFPKTAHWEYSSYKECASGNPDDCKTLCYVEKPAVYKTIPIKTLISDATTEEVPIPEETGYYTKKVIDQPARCEEVEIPAQYATIKRRVVEEPAKVLEETVPAKYVEVKKQVLVKPGGVTVWKEIDCGLVKPNKLNIRWPLNSAKLTAQAKREIDRVLIPLLKNNPGTRIELSSHTDSRGSKEYNKRLSQMRADAIKNYLISKGIDPSRIVSKGYGEERLLNNCSDGVPCSEAQHAVNRRTEYRIINAE
ncbi:MAG: OmpA family protein [Chlorobi bacterium]|nr:OmpA family protein [Chlorobiota bacterium]